MSNQSIANMNKLYIDENTVVLINAKSGDILHNQLIRYIE